MLRRTQVTNMMRRTAARLSERAEPIIDPAKDVGAATVPGFFGTTYNGSMAFVRFLDPKWILNRVVSLGRDGYVAAFAFWGFMWSMWWNVPQIALWGDGKPPRKVDWNFEKAGALPANFQMTKL